MNYLATPAKGVYCFHIHHLPEARHRILASGCGIVISCDDNPIQTAGPQSYRLIGIIQSNPFTDAAISVGKHEQFLYRLLEKLPDGSQLVGVRENHTIL